MKFNTNSTIINPSHKKNHKSICGALIRNYKKITCIFVMYYFSISLWSIRVQIILSQRSFVTTLLIRLPLQKNIEYILLSLSYVFSLSCPFPTDKCAFSIFQTVTLNRLSKVVSTEM